MEHMEESLYGVMARLLYGTTIRLLECVRLKIKDVKVRHRTDFSLSR